MQLDKSEFLAVVEYTPLVSIDLIVRNADGRVLLGYRRNEPAKNSWFVPGGRIYKDETIAAAFQRISEAELGQPQSLENAHFLGVFQHFHRENFAEKAGFGTHYVVLAYELSLLSLHSALPKAQHNKYQWLDVETLLRTPDVHELVKAYFRAGGSVSKH